MFSFRGATTPCGDAGQQALRVACCLCVAAIPGDRSGKKLDFCFDYLSSLRLQVHPGPGRFRNILDYDCLFDYQSSLKLQVNPEPGRGGE